jgi:hypothetical protein
MTKIQLYNRDGADLWLENTGEQAAENIAIWKLCVDDKHKYFLEHVGIVGSIYDIEAIDPPGGPMLSVGDTFENKYEIVKINSTNSIWIGEKYNH